MPSRNEMREKLISSADAFNLQTADGSVGKIRDAISFLNNGIELQVK